MSTKAVGYALEARVGDAGRKVILLAMADSANTSTGVMWHSVASIANMAECSTRTVQRALEVLIADGFIRPGSQAFVQHIRSDRRPAVYEIAASEATRLAWKNGASDRHPVRGDTGDAHGVTDSASRGDTAMSPEPEGNRKRNQKNTLAQRSASSAWVESALFETFWEMYPRKVGKRIAAKSLAAALSRASDEEIMAGVQRLAEDPNLPPKDKIPHPTTWLNRDGWNDEPYPASSDRQAATGIKVSAIVDHQKAWA